MGGTHLDIYHNAWVFSVILRHQLNSRCNGTRSESGARFTKHLTIYEFKSLINSYEVMPEIIRGIPVYELICRI